MKEVAGNGIGRRWRENDGLSATVEQVLLADRRRQDQQDMEKLAALKVMTCRLSDSCYQG